MRPNARPIVTHHHTPEGVIETCPQCAHRLPTMVYRIHRRAHRTPHHTCIAPKADTPEPTPGTTQHGESRT